MFINNRVSVAVRFMLAFVLTAGMFGLKPATTVYASTLIVTTTNDSGEGSLREAIADASSGDTINFDPSLSGQTITLASTLVINKNLTIDGSSLLTQLSISGNNSVSVFQIELNAKVTLMSLIIKNGSGGLGGGIQNHGILNLKNCSLINNTAYAGGGIFNGGVGGGDIYAMLSVVNCTFSGNSASDWGGGIRNYTGMLNILNSAFANNSAQRGGGLYADDGNIAVSGSVFTNNSAAYGGAIDNPEFATLNVENSTFSNNSAITAGGGIHNSVPGVVLTITASTFSENSAERGGGVYNSTPLTLSNSTFYKNSASQLGGGVFNSFATLNVINSTFSENSAYFYGGGIYNWDSNSSILYLRNTILANSISGEDCYVADGGIVAVSENNLIESNASGVNACGTPASTSDPNLALLANNGGFTQTMALLPGSPAIDAGNDANCPATDQRGVTRPQGSHCDIGAYELETTFTTLALNSLALEDGWILESSETSNKGGKLNKGATTLRVGDDPANKQYRSILSFDTSTLPVGAEITAVTLKFKHAGVSGTNPFTTHGKLLVDICEGAFKGNPALQLADFNVKCPAGVYKAKALIYPNSKVGNWYSQSLNPLDFQFINLEGVTQFRLRFTKDDNNDFGADFLKLFSGDALNEADRPQLVIEYNMP